MQRLTFARFVFGKYSDKFVLYFYLQKLILTIFFKTVIAVLVLQRMIFCFLTYWIKNNIGSHWLIWYIFGNFIENMSYCQYHVKHKYTFGHHKNTSPLKFIKNLPFTKINSHEFHVVAISRYSHFTLLWKVNSSNT